MKGRVFGGPSPVRSVASHKISAPLAHRHAIERERLLSRMFDAEAPPLVFIHGPAGHGKTSLMLQAQGLCRARGMLTGWLTLDESDNDGYRFFGDAQEMVSALGIDTRPEATQSGDEPSPGGVSRADWLIGRLLELERPVALFIDDLHYIGDRVVLSFLRELLAGSADPIRWFIASRVVPDIGLPRLLVGQRAMIIRPEELRFTTTEVQRYFEESRELEVSAKELEAIHKATEGWPAAVQLYRLALDSPQVRESLRSGRELHVREMTDYLADNILTRQPPRLQDFLLKTSVLERMAAPLCDAILQAQDSQELLSHLERTGLFVRRIDSDQQWFTYHAVFRRFLRDTLQAAEAPASIESLHRRAARWHREEGHFEEALHHFAMAGDHAPAADVFELWAERLVPDGHMATVDRWSDVVPMEELERRPGLVVKIVWALAFLSRHRKLEPFLRLLPTAPQHSAASGDPRVALSMVAILDDDLGKAYRLVDGIDTDVVSGSRFRNFELSAVANARGYHLMVAGRHCEALRQLERGRVLSELAGANFAWAYAIGKSALTLMSQGQLQEALVLYRKALSGPRMHGEESQSTACLACGYVAALYEANEFDQALEQFRQYRELITSAGVHDYLVVAYRAIARIHDCRGDPQLALETLEEAEQLAYSGQWPRVLRLIAWERVRRELLAGQLDRARIIAGRIQPGRERADAGLVRFSEDAEDGTLGRIRLHLHAGEHREAQRLLQPCLEHALNSGRVHRQMKLHALAAIARRKAGKAFQAQQSLEQALSLAAPGHYARALLDEGEDMTQLMLEYVGTRAALGAGSERGVDRFLARLLESSGPESTEHAADGPATQTAPIRLEDFTEREQQILSQIVNYLSNEQIAANLVVTRDTVKFHIKNIYAKLGVRNRLEAIRAVRQRGG